MTSCAAIDRGGQNLMLSLLSDTRLLSSRFGSNSKQTVDSPRFYSLNEI